MNDPIKFGSVCSGIEAASVAWHPFGWRAAWLSEIEANPSAMLAHHYPDVPNLGDMRLIPGLLRSGLIYPPDVLCGGTPCQAFSLAGLRNSLDDARGNLSLTYCKVADEIDIQRAANGLLPCVAVWENVPGVLSTHDNAFGHFLAGLAGEDEALVPEPCPPAGKSSRYWRWDKKSGQHTLGWPKSGAVIGPQRAIAWRVLDAQYFGLAQRRRRVFVVASARDGFDPAAVLFEFDGVRRDSAPSRETQQDAAAGTLRSTDGGCDVDHARAGHLVECFGGGNTSGSLEVAACLTARGMRIDFEVETFAVQPALSVALRGREGGATAELGDEISTCLRASTGGGDKPHVLAPIAFDSRQDCVSSTEVFGALGSSSPQAQAVCVTGDITHTLKAEGFDASKDSTGRGQPIVAYGISPDCFDRDGEGVDGTAGERSGLGVDVELAYSLRAKRPGGVATDMAVRRLTPMECERLQGFPDDYTLVPLPERRKEARGEPRMMADGPRYKALGNSWAVPVVRWLGRRIDAQLRALEARAA